MPGPIFYNSFLEQIVGINWETDTIKILLTTSAYTPNIDTHEFRDDITNEVVGAGYTAGGAALTGKSITIDLVTDKAHYGAANFEIPTVTLTGVRKAVCYKATGGAASTDPLICYWDFGTDQAVSAGGTFRMNWTAGGVFRLYQAVA